MDEKNQQNNQNAEGEKNAQPNQEGDGQAHSQAPGQGQGQGQAPAPHVGGDVSYGIRSSHLPTYLNSSRDAPDMFLLAVTPLHCSSKAVY